MDATVETLTETFAHPLTGAKVDYDPLLDVIGDASLVLLGLARDARFYPPTSG